MARNDFIRQLGHAHPTGCARKGCGKNPQYRVILGSWDVQVYVCTPDIAWAVNLDLITDSQGEAMGWEWGHAQPGTTIRASIPAQVIPELGVITRTEYGRDVASQISASYPIYREGDDIPYFRPID